MYELREATEGDHDFLYDLLKYTMKEYYTAAFGGWDERVERDFFDCDLRNCKYQLIICNETYIGCLSLTNHSDHIFINELQILPQFQGRGFGRAVVEAVVLDARKRGVSISLEVLKVNGRAQDFYARLGFTKSGETASHYTMCRNTYTRLCGKTRYVAPEPK